jgi:hypothetical protein
VIYISRNLMGNPMTHKEPTRMARNPTKTPRVRTSRDQDKDKGAMEQDGDQRGGNTSMQGQLGHRDQDAELKDADSNLPG